MIENRKMPEKAEPDYHTIYVKYFRQLFILCGLCAGGLWAQSVPDVATSAGSDYVRPVSWRMLPSNILSDQKSIWLFPVKAAEGKHWMPTVAVITLTAGLIATDSHPARYFHDNASSFNGFNKAFSGANTEIATIAVPVAMFGFGLIKRDSKLRQTAMLAGEALLDAEVVTTVMKSIDGRTRPANSTTYKDTWFQDPQPPWHARGSFPSGHTSAAFAVAGVVAQRYGNHKWAPYAAYGTAALIGISRLTLSAHYVSDVFFGAALGYSVSRFAVLRY